MSLPIRSATLVRLETELRDYYKRINTSGRTLLIDVKSCNSTEDYYSFSVELSLVPYAGERVELAYYIFFNARGDAPDTECVIKKLNTIISKRLRKAELLVELCPDQLRGKQ